MNPDIPEATFEAIIQAITGGATVQAALDAHACTRYDYDKALRKDPLKSKAHARARQAGVDAMADAVPHIADTEKDPQTARNRIEARKWLASVVKPREYGARLDLTVTPGANPAELHDEGMRRARLGRDPEALLIGQDIEDAELLPASATDGQSVPARTPSIFD